MIDVVFTAWAAVIGTDFIQLVFVAIVFHTLLASLIDFFFL